MKHELNVGILHILHVCYDEFSKEFSRMLSGTLRKKSIMISMLIECNVREINVI